ncbi:MAG TPA: hypothetical protein VFO21_15425 [Vicinamibacterales bacterium]|nr:hypothetical protein [Vicinamibacterales bacterium]
MPPPQEHPLAVIGTAIARFSPRPASSARIRKFEWIVSSASIANGSGQLETRPVLGE